jgi:hypothetical protein
VLELLEVPRKDVIPISAEDAYDTVSEAERVGKTLVTEKFRSIMITTSKYHTRRARHIWRRLFGAHLEIRCVGARDDRFSPEGWWKDGRQVRSVLAEYGAWLYYFWKRGKVADG